MTDRRITLFKSIEIALIFAGLTISAIGLRVGIGALTEYKKVNSYSAFNMLNDREARIYDRLRENDQLRSFWAYSEKTMDVKARMALRLQILIPDSVRRRDSGPALDLSFDSMEDLDNKLWSDAAFSDERYRYLRDAYDFAEETLFVAENAYAAYVAGTISKDVWLTYETYVREVGDHPIYLEAVYWLHEVGGYSWEFANELQRLYQSDKRLRKAAQIVYPEILTRSQWMGSLGMRQSLY